LEPDKVPGRENNVYGQSGLHNCKLRRRENSFEFPEVDLGGRQQSESLQMLKCVWIKSGC